MSDNIVKLLNKAQALLNTENYSACEKLLLKIKNISPDNDQMLNMLGCIELSKDNYSSAEKLILRSIEKNSNNATYYYNLGLIYQKAQVFDRAINCYEKSISLDPNLAHVHTNLSIVLRKIKRYDLSVLHAEKAVKITPNDATVNNNLGVSFESFGDYSRALKSYEKALSLSPNSVEILRNMASIYVAHDQKDKAKACYQKILSFIPGDGAACRGLVGIKKFTDLTDPDLLNIKSILDQNKLSEINKTHLLFSLGKIYDDCGAYDLAFAALQKGNDIVDRKMNLNMGTLSSYVDSHISTFTKEFYASRSDFGRSETMPIFVLGMPRSGTSLVETILASHSLVYGAGELDWFDQLVSALPGLTGNKVQYPECVTQLNAKTIHNLGEKYIHYLTMLSNDTEYIVNKLPANFQRLGVIRLLFPKAKIIHCCRNPMDTCMSIYSRLFPNNLPWSYNLSKLGEYYTEYDRLMQHWHTVMPDDYIFDIQYEDLVANQKSVTKNLIDVVGLPWEDSCLDYYKNKRGVRTASSQQVKQPVYNSSIGRWRHYEKHLGPLMKAMTKVKKDY